MKDEDYAGFSLYSTVAFSNSYTISHYQDFSR